APPRVALLALSYGPRGEPPHSGPCGNGVVRRSAPAAPARFAMPRRALRASAPCELHESAEVPRPCFPASPPDWHTPRFVSFRPLRLRAAAEASRQHAEPLTGQ